MSSNVNLFNSIKQTQIHPEISIQLSSTDCFFLALERHGGQAGSSGSICRYVLELEGPLSIKTMQHKIDKSKELQRLSTLTITRKGFLKIPVWTNSNPPSPYLVELHNDDELIPKAILERSHMAEDGKSIAFDLVHRSNGNTTFIMSWHHLLMDGYGALELLRRINENGEGDVFSEKYLISRPRSFSIFWKSTKLFLWYTALFWTPFAHKWKSGIKSIKGLNRIHQKIKRIELTHHETKMMHKKAAAHGATVGDSSFVLGCSALAVKEMLRSKNKSIRKFWIPVPKNMRKVGAAGPILGNHLSFLFYSIKKKELDSLSTLVQSLQSQFINQIRRDDPTVYDKLMRGFRRLPSGLYYRLVKGSRGNNLASFLFTNAATHPENFNRFLDCKIHRAMTLPPNTYPPGFTIASMKNGGCLNLIFMYYQEIWSDDEVQMMEGMLKNYLFG